MKYSIAILRVLAVVIAVLVSCYMFMGNKIMAVMENGIQETFEPEEDQDWKDRKKG